MPYKFPDGKQRSIKRENLRIVDETKEVAGNNESQAAVGSSEPPLLRAAASGDLESLINVDFDDDENEEQPASSSSSAPAPAPAAQMACIECDGLFAAVQ